MPKYRAQIVWEFEFQENGYQASEIEYFNDQFNGNEILKPRTPEEMAEYAKEEFLTVLLHPEQYGNFIEMVQVIDLTKNTTEGK